MEDVARLVEAVVAALEGDHGWATRVAADAAREIAVVLAEALVHAGLRARWDAQLRRAGRAELRARGALAREPSGDRCGGNREPAGAAPGLPGEVWGVPVRVALLPRLAPRVDDADP